MYAAEILASEQIEIYAESTRVLLYIFGVSLGIAVFGGVMNRINTALAVRSKQKSYKQQSVVFMNQRSHEAKGFNGGSLHFNIASENKVIANAELHDLREFLLKLSFRSLEGRLREVERWRKGKFVSAMLKESLSIVIKRIDKDIETTNTEITLQEAHDRKEYIKALKALNEAVAFGELESIHQAVLDGAAAMKDSPQDNRIEMIDLHLNAAHKCMVFAELEQAIIYYEKACELQREITGHLHEKFAECLNELGYAHHLAENHEKATACHENALTIYSRTIGSERLETGLTQNAIGISLASNNEFEKALKHHFHALPILVKNFGEHYPSVAATYSNIAVALNGSGQYERAVEYHQKAIDCDLKYFGKNHKSVAIYQNLLGLAQYQLAHMDEAIASFKKSLEIAEKVFGNEHPTTATICNNLGGVVYATEDYDAAIKYYNRALSINMQAFDGNHENIAVNLGNLGSAWKKKGGFARAIDYYKNALEIELQKFGEMHATVATTYDNLGGALRGKGEFEEAIKYKQKALDISLKLYGEHHENIAICYNGIAKTYEAMEEYQKAIDFFEKTLMVNVKLNGGDDINAARAYMNLGRVMKLAKQYDNAQNSYEQAIAIYKKLPGEERQVIEIYEYLADVANSSGNAKKALLFAEKAQDLAIKIDDSGLVSQAAAIVQKMKERLAVSM